MLYRTLKRMIERGQTNGLEEKIDIFFAAGKLTESEYQELIAMLKAEYSRDFSRRGRSAPDPYDPGANRPRQNQPLVSTRQSHWQGDQC